MKHFAGTYLKSENTHTGIVGIESNKIGEDKVFHEKYEIFQIKIPSNPFVWYETIVLKYFENIYRMKCHGCRFIIQ